MFSRQTNDSKTISLLALFAAMFAFITAFANFFYQSNGESHSQSVVNITTNITTTTYFPKSFVIGGTGIVIGGMELSFLVGIFAFVVSMVALIVILHCSETIDKNKEASVSDTPPVSPASETRTSPLPDSLKPDIDTFCKSVIAWKVSATKKEGMFQLFMDNPYYLMGYLAYITKVNIDETKILQNKIIAFTIVSIIIAMGSMAFTGYAIHPEFIIPGIGVYAIVMIGVFYTLSIKKF
jgi:hypothetical protein